MDKKSSGVGLVTALTTMFICLKLLGKITWSWLWILSPTWIPISLTLLAVLGAYLYRKTAIKWGGEKTTGKKR